MCSVKGMRLIGISLVAIGVAYVLRDMGIWAFGYLDIWTVLTLLAGFVLLGMSVDGGCCACCRSEEPVREAERKVEAAEHKAEALKPAPAAPNDTKPEPKRELPRIDVKPVPPLKAKKR